MRRSEIKVLIMRAPGSNCDAETARAFRDLGVQANVVHTQRVFAERNLLDYDVLVFPGGFSYGDYVRSGAIWAKECEYRIGPELERFVDDGRPVIGICNGFQLLVEAGFLPGFEGRSNYPQAALANNPAGFQCRWIKVKHLNGDRCAMMGGIPKDTVLSMPVAHGEGRFVFPREKEEAYLLKLYENDQLVFRYVKPDGSFAEEEAFHNPDGAWHDIAGICNADGNVLGIMPHPERAYFGWLMPEWTKGEKRPEYGDGRIFFESVVSYVEKKL